MMPADLLDLIPHRRPFLFIDEVIEVSNDRISAAWRADPEAPFFTGHYPGNPVTPGVLICEAVFQAGALLMAGRLGEEGMKGHTPILTRITEAKFKQMVRPGQMLGIEVALDDHLGDAFYMTGRVTVEGRQALRVQFVVKLTETSREER